MKTKKRIILKSVKMNSKKLGRMWEVEKVITNRKYAAALLTDGGHLEEERLNSVLIIAKAHLEKVVQELLLSKNEIGKSFQLIAQEKLIELAPELQEKYEVYVSKVSYGNVYEVEVELGYRIKDGWKQSESRRLLTRSVVDQINSYSTLSASVSGNNFRPMGANTIRANTIFGSSITGITANTITGSFAPTDSHSTVGWDRALRDPDTYEDMRVQFARERFGIGITNNNSIAIPGRMGEISNAPTNINNEQERLAVFEDMRRQIEQRVRPFEGANLAADAHHIESTIQRILDNYVYRGIIQSFTVDCSMQDIGWGEGMRISIDVEESNGRGSRRIGMQLQLEV